MQAEVSIRKQFLMMLATGRPVSGEQLARRLGCSRAAISRQSAVLKKSGLHIHAAPGSGYRLRWPLSLLNEAVIASCLRSSAPLHVYERVASTNQLLMMAAGVEDGEACLAELQSAGRGRLGREWWSAPYRNILLSMAWNWQQGPAALSGFSLAAGVAVVEALSAWKLPELALKWPNDILCQGQKLAGLLIEIRGEGEGPCRVVLGLGLNVHNPDPPDSLAGTLIDMQAVVAAEVDRNHLASKLITALQVMMRDFREYGFKPFQARWNALHAYHGYQVIVSGGGPCINGKAMGVNFRGELEVEDVAGIIHHCIGGTLSLRPQAGS